MPRLNYIHTYGPTTGDKVGSNKNDNDDDD